MAGIRERDKRAEANSGFDGLWQFRTTFVLCSQYVLFQPREAFRLCPSVPDLMVSSARIAISSLGFPVPQVDFESAVARSVHNGTDGRASAY
jgi:hypothetical protein